mmetsp:Transcript_20340/g.46148  ORF Transcript_20340/g.46148 Transcript_20340/m.46148 type:complete len:114 (-) Transcript_20340:30-371(-)
MHTKPAPNTDPCTHKRASGKWRQWSNGVQQYCNWNRLGQPHVRWYSFLSSAVSAPWLPNTERIARKKTIQRQLASAADISVGKVWIFSRLGARHENVATLQDDVQDVRTVLMF